MVKGQDHTSAAAKSRWLGVGAAFVALTLVLVLLWGAEDTADVAVSDAPPPVPVVSIMNVRPAESIARVAAFAELRPRWDAEIRTAVAGRIAAVHDGALAGERVGAGAPLFSIEKTQYVTAVAAAELGLEQARLTLWNAKNATQLARGEFERAGRQPPNELALRLPQLRIAERSIAAAEAQLASAKRQLADTEVRAPFAGFVTERRASLGQTVAAGEALLRLADDRHFEAVVELSDADWALLRQPIAGHTVELSHRDGSALGPGRIRDGGGFLDRSTRQRRIFLDVQIADTKALAGDFVRVEFAGRRLQRTLTVPEAAVTQAGYLWLVDADNLLGRFQSQVLFRADGAITVAAPSSATLFRIAATPLASFLPGQRVAPQPAVDDPSLGPVTRPKAVIPSVLSPASGTGR